MLCSSAVCWRSARLEVSHAVHILRCRPACQEMQSNAFSCGLPLPQPGQPFYFVEVSEVPVPSGAPLSALPPRALYSRVSQVRCLRGTLLLWQALDA